MTAEAAQEHATHVFIVLNPVAGSCTAEDVRGAIERHFKAPRWNYEIYETSADEQLSDIVREALQRGVGVVVAAGGDGTISKVAEGLVATEARLGIIPVGTANVLARELSIPLDLEGACALLAGEQAVARLDAMQVGEQYFLLQIGIGIDSLMIRDTEREKKRRFGRAAYLWTAARWLIGYQPVRFTIVADGRRMRPRASEVLIANGGIMGMPPFRWGPHIRPDDGQVEVCIISAQTAIDYLLVFWSVLLGRHHRSRNVRYLEARRSVAISADRPLPIQADGEIIGETPVRVQVVPQAITVIVPVTAASWARETAAADPIGA